MSLIIAFDLQDYAILATERRGLVNYRNSNLSLELFRTDHCRKLRRIPFGFYASAGDYFLTECFDIEANKKANQIINLDRILLDTHTRYCNLKGVAHFEENTKILLIAQGTDEGTPDFLLEIIFDKDKIQVQEVEAMSLVALMSKMNPNPIFWQNIGHSLRGIKCFDSPAQFLDYHIKLIRTIWQEQLTFDDNISSHIDLYCHHKISSTGIYIPSKALHQTNFLQSISFWTEEHLFRSR